MKIIVVASLAFSLLRFRGELLKEMAEKGHEVLTVAPDFSEKIKEQLNSFGIRAKEITLSRTGLNPLTDIKTIVELARLFRSEAPDCILSYTIKPVLYASFAAQIVGIRNIYSIITGAGYAFIEQKSLKRKVVNFVASILYKHALKANCCVFFQNPDDLEEFQKRKLIKLDMTTRIVNGSGVNLQKFFPASLPIEPSFLLIARLVADKGVREYVDAARLLKSQYPAVKFYLAGDFDTNPSFIRKEEMQAWEDDGIIEYLGVLDDVRSAIVRCLVFVLPSYREGIPKVVLEAMSMGRPIITTDVPGCRETVVHEENGFLVPPRNSRKLAEAMSLFIQNPGIASKMGEVSRQMAEQKFDVYKVNKIILDVMEC